MAVEGVPVGQRELPMGRLGWWHPAPLHRCGEERRHSAVNDQLQSPGPPAGSAPARSQPVLGPEHRKSQADLPQTEESPGSQHHSSQINHQASSDGQNCTLAWEALLGWSAEDPELATLPEGPRRCGRDRAFWGHLSTLLLNS